MIFTCHVITVVGLVVTVWLLACVIAHEIRAYRNSRPPSA